MEIRRLLRKGKVVDLYAFFSFWTKISRDICNLACLHLKGSETTIFPCEGWLAKSEDDGETVRELVPSDIIIERLLRDGTLKCTETEVEDALESM